MIRTLNKLAIITTIVTAYGCSSEHQNTSQTQSMIGEDNLREVTDPALRSKIGVLSNGQVSCTAFLSDATEITTAAHCVEKFDIKNFKFTPSDSVVGYKVQIKKIRSEIDLAVLSVEAKKSAKLEFGEAKDGKATLVAYNSSTHKLVKDEQCSVSHDKTRPGLLTHTCDSFEGMSGGILIQEGRVVGVHLGSLVANQLNVALESKYRQDVTLKINRNEIVPEKALWGRCVPWCPEDAPRLPEIPPVEIPGMNSVWAGVLVGGPLGALLNDRLALEEKLREMRKAGAEREAQFLELKAQLSTQGQERDALKNQLACETAKSQFLPGLDAIYQGFVASIQDATSDEAANSAWENYKNASDALFAAARNVCQ